MNEIVYLGYYTCPEIYSEKRYNSPAAVNKMNYISYAINSIGYKVRIVSNSGTTLDKTFPGRIICLNEKLNVCFFKTVGGKSLFKRALNLIQKTCRIIKFFSGVSKDSVVVVYYSIGYMNVIFLLKKIIKFHMILEVEEIYSDVLQNERMKKSELRLFKEADAFIFSTQLLDTAINQEKKPSVVINGTYQVEENRKGKIFNDDKIHVVYAGTLDPRKGGAAAVAAAKFLPENYHIHILGFGTNEQIENIKSIIEQNSDKKTAEVSYDGLLSGEEYIRFLRSCDIGLSTQNPDATFNGTSFPSKILSYMANGLRVVSIDIESVRESEVGDLITYYDEQLPENIAKAIESVDMSFPYDSRQRLMELNQKFQKEMGKLIEDISHES